MLSTKERFSFKIFNRPLEVHIKIKVKFIKFNVDGRKTIQRVIFFIYCLGAYNKAILDLSDFEI